MGCCCGKKPRELPKQGQTTEQKYQEPPIKNEEVEVEQIKKAEHVVKQSPPEFTLNDIEKINGSYKLNKNEKLNLLRAVIILESKGLKVIQVVCPISFGIILNVQQSEGKGKNNQRNITDSERSIKDSEIKDKNSEGKVTCMKLIFHDEEIFPSGNNESEVQRILNKEVEVMKRQNDKRVVKYKCHFIDNGKSLNSPTLEQMCKDLILFVELEDSIKGTFDSFISYNRGQLNDRQFLLKCQDLILGMDHLHKQKCIARSAWPERILVSNDVFENLKYCDFRDSNYQDKNQKQKNYNINALILNERLQSPQIKYYIKEDKSKVLTNEKSDIWTMGASLCLLADVNDQKFDEFSDPSKNQGYVGDDQQARIQFQKNALLKSLVSFTPNFENNNNAGTNTNQSSYSDFPRTVKLNEDCNMLLEQIVEVDENERSMQKIVTQIQFLQIKYHLDTIHQRQELDYIKGKLSEKAPEKSKKQELQQAIENNPNNAESYAKLALWYNEHDKENNKKGIELMEKAIELDPTNSNNYNSLAVMQERELLIMQAMKNYMNAMQQDARNSLTHYNFGILNQKIMNKPETAIENYQQALRRDSRNHSAKFNLALANKESNKPAEALRVYQSYLENHPQDSQTLNNIGVLYSQYPELRDLNNQQETEPELLFDQALTSDSNDLFALLNKVQCLIKKEYGYEKHEDEINKKLKQALELSPENAYAHYIKGLVEMSKPDPIWEKAVDYFNTALRFNPAFSLAIYQIGVIYFEVEKLGKNINESIECLEKAVIYDRNNYLAFYSLSLAQEELLKITSNQAEVSKLRYKCLTNYKKALGINPNYIEALNNIAVLLKQIAYQEGKLKKNCKEYQIVEKYFKQAESLAPNNKIIIDNLQKLYVEANQDDLAQQRNIKSTLVGEE